MEEFSFFEILFYAGAFVYSLAVIVLTFKLMAFCDKFDELLKIVRHQTGVREYKDKIVRCHEDGTIIGDNEHLN